MQKKHHLMNPGLHGQMKPGLMLHEENELAILEWIRAQPPQGAGRPARQKVGAAEASSR